MDLKNLQTIYPTKMYNSKKANKGEKAKRYSPYFIGFYLYYFIKAQEGVLGQILHLDFALCVFSALSTCFYGIKKFPVFFEIWPSKFGVHMQFL